MSRKKPQRPCYLVGEGRSFELSGDALLGRGDGVDIQARGFFVSPVHARITRLKDGQVQLSCFGSGKVKVNGKKVAAARLAFGDEMVVGRSKLALAAEPGAS